MSTDHQRSFGIWSQPYYAAASSQRSSNVQISFNIEGHALRTSQPAIKDADGSMLINAIDRVEAGSGGPGNVQDSVRTEGQVIGGDAGLESGEDKNLAVAADFEDGSAAVPDVEILLAVKSDAGSDAHALCVRRHGSIGRNFVHRAIEAG